MAGAIVVLWLLVIGWRDQRPGTPGSTWSAPMPFNARQVVLAVWTAIAMTILVVAIREGLLGRPEMQIEGNGSTAWSLFWYSDRVAGPLPRPWVLSVPMLVYRGAMLAWALWLAMALLGWLRWGYGAFTRGGLWRRTPPSPPRTPPSSSGGGGKLDLDAPDRGRRAAPSEEASTLDAKPPPPPPAPSPTDGSGG
jgi:hypothetical protein